jgi:hypothetical protein
MTSRQETWGEDSSFTPLLVLQCFRDNLKPPFETVQRHKILQVVEHLATLGVGRLVQVKCSA